MYKAVFLSLGFFVIIVSVTAVPQCPDQDENSEAAYLPHETECGEFYECQYGIAFLLQCPTSTYWDVKLNVCDKNVDCGNLRTSTAPPTTTEDPTTLETDASTTSTIPTATSTIPTDTSTIPTDTSTIPTATSTIPTDTSTIPTATSTIPTDTSEIPTASTEENSVN